MVAPQFILKIRQREKTNMHTQGNSINIINVMTNIIKAKKLSSQNRTGSYTYVYEW